MTKRKTYNQRKREQKIRRAICAVIGILLVFVAAIVVYVNFGNSDVREQEGMSRYARSQVSDIKVFRSRDTKLSKCYTDEHIGVASYDDDCEYDYVNAQKDYYIDELKKELVEDGQYKVLLTNAVTCESSRNTVSLLITYQTGQLKNKEVTNIKRGVKGYIFNKKTQDPIGWHQLFKENYQDELKATLGEGYTDYKAYVIDKEELTYFFVDKKYNITVSEINADKSSDWMRDKVLERYVDPNKLMVAFTYDDGPGLKSETRIHDVLEKYDGVATFFYSGYMVKGKEYQIKRSLHNNCEIGSHTWNHPLLTRCSKKELRKQLNKTNRVIEVACGSGPTVFRPSYGATNDKINKKAALPVILWNIDTQDWKSKDANKIYKKVVKNKKLDGSIVLMHSIYDSTAKATEKIVPWLHEHGYQMVTVSELIKAKTGKDPVKSKVYTDMR